MILEKNYEKFFKKFFSASNAQAFLLAGGNSDLEDLLIKFLKCEKKEFCRTCRGCRSENSLDLKIYEGNELKIAEAREIYSAAGQSSFAGPKIFLIKNIYLSAESQATLLKTIEEPSPETYFIFSIFSESAFLPPFLSRLTIFSVKSREEKDAGREFKISLDEAINFSKDSRKVEDLFLKFEKWTEEELKKASGEKLKKFKNFLEDLFETKRRFFEKTYSSRMLLEHLVISKYYLER